MGFEGGFKLGQKWSTEQRLALSTGQVGVIRILVAVKAKLRTVE